MSDDRTALKTIPLEELPLLPGQAEALARAGCADAQELLRHPLVQEALLRLLRGDDPGPDPEVLSLPVAAFLDGPGVETLHRSGCRTLSDLLRLGPAQIAGLSQVRWQHGALLSALGVSGQDRILDQPIESAGLSARGRTACLALGVKTLGEFLALDRKAFLAVPGVGRKTYADLLQSVQKKVRGAGRAEEPAGGGPQTLLADLVENRRALKAFQELGLKTVEEFLRTPREEFLKLRNCGERTWYEVSERVQAALGGAPPIPAACPAVLLDLRLESLPLSRKVREHLGALSLATVRDLFRLPRGALLGRQGFGEASWRELVGALDQAVRQGLQRLAAASDSLAGLPDLLRALVTPLTDPRVRFVLEARAGVGGRPLTLKALAARLGLSRERVRQLAAEARAQVQRNARPCLLRLWEETDDALAREKGLLTVAALARLPLAQGPGGSRRRGRTLRGVLLFFFPERLRLLTTGALTSADPGAVRRLQRTMSGLLARTREPLAPGALGPCLEKAGLDPGAHAGLALHLARFRFGMELEAADGGGEPRLIRPAGIVERLRALLEEQPRPLALDDLLLLYRSRHGLAGRKRLRAALTSGNGFWRVGPRLYDLAERVQVSADEASRWRDDAAARLAAARRPLPAERLGSGMDPFLLAGVLSGTPGIRPLGRLLFTEAGAGTERPSWVEALVHGHLEARGEPMDAEELAAIQGPAGATLLEFARESRSLARFPDGRIGLVEWHPFGPAARTELVEASVLWLERNNGYGRLARLQRGLGGLLPEGTGPALLRDVLVRDGRFELFGREWVALARAGTADWVRERALSALREAGAPLSLPLLLAACPELAEFEDAVEELLEGHPLVSALKDGSYAVPR